MDFSSPYEDYHFFCKREFMNVWKENYTNYGTDYTDYNLRGAKLKKQLRCFPWLRSAADFTALLQRVLRSTEAWLQGVARIDSDSMAVIDIVDSVRGTTQEFLSRADSGTTLAQNRNGGAIGTTSNTSADVDTNSITKPKALEVSPPHHVRELVREFKEWVPKWNIHCDEVFDWMPFPKRPQV